MTNPLNVTNIKGAPANAAGPLHRSPSAKKKPINLVGGKGSKKSPRKTIGDDAGAGS